MVQIFVLVSSEYHSPHTSKKGTRVNPSWRDLNTPDGCARSTPSPPGTHSTIPSSSKVHLPFSPTRIFCPRRRRDRRGLYGISSLTGMPSSYPTHLINAYITNRVYRWSESWAVSTWSLGSSLIALGATVRDALLVILFANLLSAVVIVLNGRAASRYHVGYPVLARTTFGIWGSYFFVVLRAILGVIWGESPLSLLDRGRVWMMGC